MFVYEGLFNLGLFHRAIAQSGSALCEWAIERAPLQYAKEVGFNAGCTTESTIDLVECLRKTPANKLLEIQSKGKVNVIIHKLYK